MYSKDRSKVLTSQFFIFTSGQGQVKEGHQNQNFQMSRLTHVSWSILDEEFDSHVFFYNLTSFEQKEDAKFIPWSGKKFKKGQIFNNFFFKQIHVSDAESRQQSNGTISYFLYADYN